MSSGKAITEVHPETDAGCDALYSEGLQEFFSFRVKLMDPTEIARARALEDNYNSGVDDVEIRPIGCKEDSSTTFDVAPKEEDKHNNFL